MVDNNLQAPETVEGHGDSFWSIALACYYIDQFKRGGQQYSSGTLANLQSIQSMKFRQQSMYYRNPGVY